ncbi:hypothetical protein NQ314_008770 [Rhamnusium bicolor]|uniref:Regulatory protein zeste n=1 Tax=Rhamnusium bicolor TaxID=1586634 RepID=A0AAV8Y5U3_9CUCU|nr:hypothetical protein NQ314_008770 [Rhamnusium bicolor]
MFEVIVRYRFVSIKIFKLKYLEFYIVLLFKINLAMSQKITGTRGNRSNRMTKSQKDFMVNFLEKNKFLLETKINPFELDKYNNSWKLLANELNKLPGANKSIPQWKQALNEFKANTRRKARLIHIQHTGTGGGPKTEKDLTNLEERLLALLSKIVILGAPSIPEAGILDKPEEPIEETIYEEFYFEDDNENVEIGIEEYIPSNETMDSPIPSNDQTWPSTSFKVVSDASKMGTIPKDSPMKTKQAMRNSKKYMKTSGVELIAKNHEECLKYLANSNNNVAAACHNLSKTLKKTRNKMFCIQP